ncbi:MAG: pyridoxal-phosphate-dependent aminotransferase family protein [Candidatus Thorarchaeota archaeon]
MEKESRQLFTAGPTTIPASVLLEMAKPIQNPDLDPDFHDWYKETCLILAKILKTRMTPLILAGEAILGLEAAINSLVSPGEKVIVLASGLFGRGFADFVEMYGGKPELFSVPDDEIITPGFAEEAVDKHPDAAAVTLIHCETPSGTLNPVEEIGKVIQQHGVPLIVDAVSSVAGADMRMDDWHVDVCIVGSQKCFSSPPGLTQIGLSSKAWEIMEEKKDTIRGYYLNLYKWKDWEETAIMPYTHSVSNLYAFRRSMDLILQEGLDNVLKRHKRVASATRAAVKALGMKLFPKAEETNSPTVTAFLPPEGISEGKLRQIVWEQYGAMIAGNYGDLAGRVPRLGHMGFDANYRKALSSLSALEKGLQDLGHKVESGVAAKAFNDAW